ncbi:exfoliative toxin A/B [Methanobrevibacter olleyae]|uniref:Exfoliative toxin A/B n=1 Tax=Methanobrevibacter olleyae TaxID=294671 RepID=A0A1I4KCS3_METOL|nr:hypothetical protein [Methanobrevibacter olleyae]SFL76584.1 exfoliative toxin A/B [Methanobrevibacter olleyae]
MNIIKNLPLAITGLILAIFSLGKIFTDFSNVFFIIGTTLVFLIILKLVLYFNRFYNELNNLIALSTFGTFSMTLMLFSTYLKPLFLPISQNIALGIWILGIIIHLLILIVFSKNYVLNNFNVENVFASWWIVYIGITMAAITAPAFNLSQYGFIFFGIGFILMIPTLILVAYRYIKFNQIEDKNKPFICIYTALFSILIVGYVNSLTINSIFLCITYICACIFYIFSIYQAIKFIFIEKMQFFPSFSAFTFPFVISTIATGEIYKFFGLSILNYLFYIQAIISLILVILVSYKYLKFLIKAQYERC